MNLSVMWFRKDLRLEDNSALNLALSQLTENDRLLCLFQLNPEQFRPGTMNHDYFFSALAHFRQEAADKGLPLHIMFGKPLVSFKHLKDQYPTWNKLYYNRDERGVGLKRDQSLESFFKWHNIEVNNPLDSHLHGATAIKKEDGTAYKMFTPYYNQWRKLPKPAYNGINVRDQKLTVVNELANFKTGEREFEKLISQLEHDFTKCVGLEKATERLNHFVLTNLVDYQKQRDIPSIDGTSQLSNYLRTGELSIRKVWHAAANMEMSDGQQTFLKELCWRDFYNMVYYENPQQQTVELKEKYRELPWKQGSEYLEVWKQGQTGYPLIDAAMRQLNRTGWMHNRLRMLVASFLTKDLLTDWRLGEAYFAEQLIDYDPASNIGGWQWAASTGTDAVPYFRIFNPTTQSKKFDSQGDFIRQYVPELVNLPNKFIHEPTLMNQVEQEKYQCLIGKDYPKPIVDHNIARQLTLEFFKAWS